MYNYYPQYNAYQPQQSGIIWVSGEQEAYSYLIAPNNAVALWDSSKPTIYMKQADASGKPSIKILDYTERTVSQPDEAKPDVNSEIEAIKNELKALRKELRKKATDDDT